MNPGLIKEARLALEGLRDELELVKRAHDLAFTLYKSGNIVAEDLETKIAEFSNKSREDLDVFEKAAELANDPKYNFGIGSLSEFPQDNGSMDNITRMLLEDL